MHPRPSPHNSQILSSPGSQDQEFTLFDVLQFLRRGKRLLVGSTLAGLLVGSALGILLPDRYSAEGSIQMAVVANEPVETPATLAEKLKLPSYYSSEIFHACGVSAAAKPGEALARKVNATLNRTAPLVGVTFEDKSPDRAEKCLQALIAHVAANQWKQAEPVVNATRQQFTTLKARLEEVEKFKTNLGTHASGFLSGDAKAGTNALVLPALSSSNQEIRELLTEISKLEILLSPTKTRPASFVTPIYVSETRTTQKRVMFALAFTAGGLFLGIAGLILLGVWRQIKQNGRGISDTSLPSA